MAKLVLIELENGTIVRQWVGNEEPPKDEVKEGDLWVQE